MAEPMKPCSSPMVQNIKSVSCSGTYFSLVWVPLRNPLPVSPLSLLQSSTVHVIPAHSNLLHTQGYFNTHLLMRLQHIVKNILYRLKEEK